MLDKSEADAELSQFDGRNRRSHLLLWGVFLFVIIAIIWAKIAIIDEVTHAEGKVIPSQQIQIVQNLEGGIVRDILIHEGQIVKPEQILMHIDDTRFSSSYRESILQAATLRAKIARLSAITEGLPLDLPNDLIENHRNIADNAQSLYQAQRTDLETRIATLKNQITQKKQALAELKSRKGQLKRSHALVTKELNITKPLIKHGAVSQVEVLRLERETNDLAGELEMTTLSIPRAQAALDEAKNKINELVMGTRSKAHDELNKIKSEYSQLQESLKALEDRVDRTAVRSPVKGIIKQMHINTIGGVVSPGMELVEIVPLDDTLLIEAKVDPKDIGFLHPGENAIVKFTAYDFSIYGGLKGNVEHISADSITDEEGKTFYEIRVRTQENFLSHSSAKLEIIPGMQATVDIITGQKSVLDYILKPVLKTKQNALRER